MRSLKQQKKSSYLRSKNYAKALLQFQDVGMSLVDLNKNPDIVDIKGNLLEANRTIKKLNNNYHTKPVNMKTDNNRKIVKSVNKALLNVINNAGTDKSPIITSREVTNAAGKIIGVAKVELAWNDRSGEMTKPDILK